MTPSQMLLDQALSPSFVKISCVQETKLLVIINTTFPN
jgi:hypothetical protein